jgi:hypothetical protein
MGGACGAYGKRRVHTSFSGRPRRRWDDIKMYLEIG